MTVLQWIYQRCCWVILIRDFSIVSGLLYNIRVCYNKMIFKGGDMVKRRLCSLSLAVALLLSGCGARVVDHSTSAALADQTESSKPSGGRLVNDTAPGTKVTVLDIKHKYAAQPEQTLSPFYNVAQDTVFQFHFNTMVEPCYAITVHTDPKCDMNSLVYQINDGYVSGSGIDVVVKPGLGVLQCDERAGNVSGNYKWGNAPIYYLAIRNDFDTGEKLSTPMIVPFTVKSDVSVPVVEANIDRGGMFYLSWRAVPDAVSYNIYSSYYRSSNTDAAQLTRAEAGFVGDHLQKIGSTTGTEFRNFKSESEPWLTELNGYVSSQNALYDNYYVTAVDSAGNESFFSFPISGWQYQSILPSTFDSYSGFGTRALDGTVERLPDTVQVTMVDKSTRTYPVNYTKTSEEYGYANYDYIIVGTSLTGTCKLKNDSADYPDTKDSSADMDYAVYKIANEINLVPTNNIETIKGKEPNLSGGVSLDPANKLPVSQEALLARADIENARIVTDGVYTVDLQTEIPSYLQDKLPPVQVQEPETTVAATEEETTEAVETPSNDTPQDDIVTMNREDTLQGIEEGNSIEVQDTGYPVFADSPEEEYLARCMMASQDVIDLSPFPRLLDGNYLGDVIYKVIRQNPYIISPTRFQWDGTDLAVAYSYDAAKNASHQAEIDRKADLIVSEVIRDGMSVEDKVLALWTYLEDNTRYDTAACEYAEANEFMVDSEEFYDSFNAYGILCNNIGVCQSYSYAFHILADKAGVDCMTLTGYMNGNLPHAWNVVDIDGSWYWIDTTNNLNTAGIPYLLYQTSYPTAEGAGYTLDNEFALDSDISEVYTSDNTKDWWYQNNLVARSLGEVTSMFQSIYKDSVAGEWVPIKLAFPSTEEEVLLAAVKGIVASGIDFEEVQDKPYMYAMNYIIVKR